MHLAERVGARLAVGLAGQRAAEDRHRLLALPVLDRRQKVIDGARLGRLDEVDAHVRRDDAGAVVADVAHRAQQLVALLVAEAGREFPEAKRQAIDLQEALHVAHVVGLVRVGPGEHAKERRLLQVARARPVLMHGPAVRAQRLGQAALEVAQFAAGALDLELALRHPVQRLRQPGRARLPLDLGRREALADGVGQVVERPLKTRDRAQHVGELVGAVDLRLRRILRRLQLPTQPRHRAAALGQLGEDMRVLLLDQLKERRLLGDETLIRQGEGTRQAGRIERAHRHVIERGTRRGARTGLQAGQR